jgi:arylsulfatase A-like enzyme
MTTKAGGSRRVPDVYVIVLDTLRASEGPNGDRPAETMPWLGAWAASDAVSYTRGVSVAPWTLPAHASLFTGLHPSVHGANELHPRLVARAPTMAEWFKDQGYRTAGVSANAWVGPEFGLARGFDAFVRVWQVRKADSDVTRVLKGAQHLSDRQKAMRVLATRRPTDALNLSFRYLRRRIRYGDFNAAGVNREAIRFVESDRSSALFLFVNYMEAHAPYWGPRRHRRRFLPAGITSLSARRIPQSSSKVNAGVATLSEADLEVLRALYRAEVRYLDERVSQLVAAIDERRGLENAVVVILSDHGDNIGDHGLLGHNYSMWETLLHVPIVIRYPGGAAGGTRDPRLAQTVDVLPTVVQVAGGTLSGAIAGRSLRSAATRETATAEYLAPMPSLETMRRKYPGADLDRFDRSLRALRTADDEKLIWDSKGEHQLYDLRADPGETTNLALQRPERVAELAGLLGRDPERSPSGAAHVAQMEDDVRRQLEAMGYLM